MTLERIESPIAPPAIGPYSHGQKCGNMIITAGQIPLYADTKQIEDDIKKATKMVLDNLLSVVEAGGGKKNTIAKVDVFVKDLADFAAINEVYTEFFGDHKPARVLIQAGDLPAGSKIEAAMIAFVAE